MDTARSNDAFNSTAPLENSAEWLHSAIYADINLYKRLTSKKCSNELLRTASFPCWQNRKKLEHYMFNDSWYLIDIETTGADIWKG